MTKASDNPFPKLILNEATTDGSDFSNPAADYRVLYLGEDGALYLKDSAGDVTPAGTSVADILDIPTAEMDDTLVLAPDGAGGVEFRAEVGGEGAPPGGPNDDEFTTTDTSDPMTGWTTLGSPSVHDMNSTVSSNYYLKDTDASDTLSGIYKAAPSFPFTVTAKMTGITHQSTSKAGLFVAESPPGKLYSIHFEAGNSVNATYWNSRTSWNSNLATQSTPHYMPLLLRIVAASTSDLTFSFSIGGSIWTPIKANYNPGVTIAAVGLMGDKNNATLALEVSFDWIRFT